MGIQTKMLDSLKRMSGVLDESEAQDIPSQVISKTATHRRYSPSEYQVLANRLRITPVTRARAQNTDLAQLISYLQPSHEHSVLLVQDNERLRALAPEISQAENIIVSSVMSPNDLQDADPIIQINPIPRLSETTADQLIALLKDYFINEHDLGKKMTKWCGEALFRSGASPVMILPESTLAAIIGHRDMVPEKEGDKVGTEALAAEYLNETTYMQLLKKPMFTRQSESSGENLVKYGNQTPGDKELESKKKAELAQAELSGLIAYMSACGFDETILEQNKTGLENIKARVTTHLEAGDTLFLSENPEIMRFGSMIRERQKKKMGDDFLVQYTNKQGEPTGQHVEENIIDLTPYVDASFKNQSSPFFLELPTESVIPICVPGSKTEKLGYFVLIDAFGRPIEASKYLSTMTGNSTSGRIQASYAAMFGDKPTDSGVKTNLFGNLNRIGNPWDLQEHAITRVFDFVLDEMLRKKLKDLGQDEITMDKYNSIATCMFYRLLEKKRTTLVFVPAELMIYTAFDYRDDGAGKSKLEDAQFILSIRVTFLVANLMAMMRNAVARKEIEISFDEKEIQFESVIDEVRQAANEKFRFTLSSDPTAIAQSINNQNTTIKVANHPNAPGFNITASDTQSQVPKADNELLDTLNSWFVTVLGVPHSVLNQLNEAEFSRSIATTNLFFSKQVRTYQSILCSFGSDYIRTTLRFSPSLQKKMCAILKGAIKKNTDSINDTDVPETTTNTMADHDPAKIDQNSAIKRMMQEVIANVEVGLPAPNIAPDRAQYEIFSDYIKFIGELVDNLFPTELVGDDSDLGTTFNTIKSFFKSSLTRQFTEQTGLEGAFTIPTLDEFIFQNNQEIKELLRIVRNTKAGIDKDKTAQTTPSNPEGAEGAEGGDTASADTSSSSSDDSSYGNWNF